MTHRWAGLTYINVVWQNKMVTGMLKSLMGSFVVVFLIMSLLFRSVLWGILSMIPLTVTICFIYGIIGWVGKDYDMPVAVLSSLTLGMSIDFAIHFIQRSKEIYAKQGDWTETCFRMFGEPGRAISRNAVVIALGFLPLLFAHLIPYRTVGFLIASIMMVSGIATLIILPSMVTVFEKLLFRRTTNSKEVVK
ncbi:MMPL family protein [Thermodesulforhabdus norvegica]|uniref:MMPL family protein n=2 Tax=Thermodesulforhabdus norvegica TaxID=39841 RepID=A0A1I4SNS9_9BACT|nr:MMPL family protein [Thermodesulforhabdus norvegica]